MLRPSPSWAAAASKAAFWPLVHFTLMTASFGLRTFFFLGFMGLEERLLQRVAVGNIFCGF